MARDLALGAVILAAGDARRFGGRRGGKLLAELDGRPVLQHVLDAVDAFEPRLTVIVLGAAMTAIGREVDLGGHVRVWNPEPRQGLSSSIRLGIMSLAAASEPLDGAFIVLGDQPLLRPATLEALAAAAGSALPADRPLVVPRYAEPGPRNPVLLLRPAWSLVDGLDGDTGLGPLIDANPDQVLEVPVEGSMPDIDTLGDLARLQAARD